MTLRAQGDGPDEWPIAEVARLAGTTSRTLRHYQAEGLLAPTRVAANGYRFYDDRALLRLQRILLLRELGLGVDAIRGVLDSEPDTVPALRTHLALLRREQERLTRQIASVEHTIETEEGGGRIMAEKLFDGFDHTQYKDEVEQHWGQDAYASGDAWWRGMTDDQKARFQAGVASLTGDWAAAAESGAAPDSEQTQALARRQYEWLLTIPGTPRGESGALVVEYFTGLGEMYVADERFAANYGGAAGAAFVRDALHHYASRHL
ncbi:TipAS antibiotic-recognition domain-containing protein [Amnibacterium flavum]|uniref:MerR family transcriptional regulator n=1 Tax=Amnibacterium flavum TaxID=2173173 RepID=A0A2V1HN58_9MICO|nr:TipAS antibiotic-recognition domain-containing protein [Amnibacterium flavum]PVZ94063.1 MerR family transcriptional regulator [Amnibacterium flavum]